MINPIKFPTNPTVASAAIVRIIVKGKTTIPTFSMDNQLFSHIDFFDMPCLS
ncbi:MAG: hypothetical protein HeimC2_01310 [Candidatus Heimdallarchaeota archaeon LC_2]|nr:MAG: hypothetical protein HeimC2_01310 [Candidatus Heimdallarchaeota archaeon LC_2]